MDLGLSNKVALITAASKGIGYAVADALASEGCDLIITSHNIENLNNAKSKLQKHRGVNISTYMFDITNPHQVSINAEKIIEDHPHIDILILNGPGPTPIPAKDIDSKIVHTAMESCLSNFVEITHKVIPLMLVKNSGRILFLASSTAKEPDEGMVLSNMSRASVISYAKTLSREVASNGITVNSILTASVLTDRTNQLLEFEANEAGIDMQTFLKEASASIPAGYICNPDEFVKGIIFLCSPHASYINGINLSIDGGYMRAL